MKKEFKIGDWVEVLPEDVFYHNSEKGPQELVNIGVDISNETVYYLKFKNGIINSYTKIKRSKKPVENKLENTCIKVLSKKHGAKVVEYYKSLGVDTVGIEGSCVNRYYGLFNGIFDHYDTPKGSRVIELPEDVVKTKSLEYPRVMMVSQDRVFWVKRVVFMEKCEKFLVWADSESLKEAENVRKTSTWAYAKEVEEEKKEKNNDLIISDDIELSRNNLVKILNMAIVHLEKLKVV